MGCIMKLVLYYLEEQARCFCTWIIINTRGINIKYLTIKHLFRRTDIPDSVEQLIPITTTTKVFHSFIIQSKPFNNIVM